MRYLVLLITASLTVACDAGLSDLEAMASDQDSALEKALRSNATWPYQTEGVLDIVEAVYEDPDSKYPSAAFGSLLTPDDDEWGVSVDIGPGVAAAAGVDIDSGEPVKVWLGAPHDPFDAGESYPITRIERL